MQIFLMWHKGSERGRSLAANDVKKRLTGLFAPLFTEPPVTHVIENDTVGLIYLERPVAHFIPPYLDRRSNDWALAIQYPWNAPVALKKAGFDDAGSSHLLLTLARALRMCPAAILSELAPMFSLISTGDKPGDIHLHNDGLGQSQMFESEQQGLWAISNRMLALRALGFDLTPEPREWAMRMVTDWMPLTMTGFKGVRYLEPGTHLHITPSGLERSRCDVVGDWIRPMGLSPQDCLDLACESFQETIRSAIPLFDHARVGLTGGWDSRAVASGFLREGADHIRFAVRGRRKSPDVIVASKLAELAGIDLDVEKPIDRSQLNASCLRLGFDRALRWQAGYIDIRQHDTFMGRSDDLGGGEVNIMGQHGEVGRGFFLERLAADRLKPHQYEDALIDFMLFRNTPTHAILRADHLEFIRETIRRAYRQADLYGLEGLDRLDFYYLYERTRRWAPAGNNIQPGQIIAPLLNPGFIRATYNYPAHLRGTNPFHSAIIDRNMPPWATVLHDKEQKARNDRKAIRKAKKKSKIRFYKSRFRDWTFELSKQYFPERINPARLGKWGLDGKPLIDEVLNSDGLWTKVYNPDRARKYWFKAPEQLVITDQLFRILDEI